MANWQGCQGTVGARDVATIVGAVLQTAQSAVRRQDREGQPGKDASGPGGTCDVATIVGAVF